MAVVLFLLSHERFFGSICSLPHSLKLVVSSRKIQVLEMDGVEICLRASADYLNTGGHGSELKQGEQTWNYASWVWPVENELPTRGWNLAIRVEIFNIPMTQKNLRCYKRREHRH